MQTDPVGNALLAALPQKTKQRIFPLLHRVELPLGQEIYAASEQEAWVYFPVDCIISILYVTIDGHSAEISLVGCDGVAGIAVFLGGGSTPTEAIVQSAGSAHRLSAADIRREFDTDPAMRRLLLRYTQALITQMAQTAVCNRHHTILQQLARWLLLSIDRLPSSELTMTQELIANMLGVRREGVTEAAGKLQKLGIIHYVRGHITVLDRHKLEGLSCECYRVVKDESDRLTAYSKTF